MSSVTRLLKFQQVSLHLAFLPGIDSVPMHYGCGQYILKIVSHLAYALFSFLIIDMEVTHSNSLFSH